MVVCIGFLLEAPYKTNLAVVETKGRNNIGGHILILASTVFIGLSLKLVHYFELS